MTQMLPELSVERLTPLDAQEALRCLQTLGPDIAGLANPSLYHALIKDASERGHPVVVVARTSAGVVGISIAFLDPRKYAVMFTMRHPVVTLRILGARVRRWLHRIAASKGGAVDRTEAALEGWPPAPHQPGAAYLLFTGALPSARGQGVGTGLIAGIGAAMVSAGANRHTPESTSTMSRACACARALDGFGSEKAANSG